MIPIANPIEFSFWPSPFRNFSGSKQSGQIWTVPKAEMRPFLHDYFLCFTDESPCPPSRFVWTCLVGGIHTYPSEKWWSSSMGNILSHMKWKVIKAMFQSPPTSHGISKNGHFFTVKSWWTVGSWVHQLQLLLNSMNKNDNGPVWKLGAPKSHVVSNFRMTSQFSGSFYVYLSFRYIQITFWLVETPYIPIGR